MSESKTIQELEAGLSESGKQLLEAIKAAVGFYGKHDPALPVFTALVSTLDRFERFGPKFADTVRQSSHEARSDAVKAGDVTMAQVVREGMVAATQEMTAAHAADIHEVKDEVVQAIRELTGEAAAVIRTAQPPTKNWRLWASVALIAQVGLLGAVGFGGWWYRDHQARESTAWAETWRGQQARQFYEIIEKSATAATGGTRVLQSGGPGEKQIKDIIAWATSAEGASAFLDRHPQQKKK